MENKLEQNEFVLLYIIVNFGLGSKVIKSAKQHGITGATVFLGKGTIKNRLLEFLDLSEIRKEIVLMVTTKTIGCTVLEELNKEFRFDKPNHGIGFSSSVLSLVGSRGHEDKESIESRGAKSPMHNAIFTVVDRGKADEVIEAATKAGARGGTIINARGSGIHETSKLFAMEIEPEKEIVLILCENSQTQQIAAAIRTELQIDEPGNGIIFTQSVNQTYGLRK